MSNGNLVNQKCFPIIWARLYEGTSLIHKVSTRYHFGDFSWQHFTEYFKVNKHEETAKSFDAWVGKTDVNPDLDGNL